MTLSIYSVWLQAENLDVVLPRRILGIFPVRRSVAMGFHAVVQVAAENPGQAQKLAQATLTDDFARIPRNAPETWHLKVRDLRHDGPAPRLIPKAGCLNNDWAAAWYPMDDPKAARHREKVVRARLWEGQRVG